MTTIKPWELYSSNVTDKCVLHTITFGDKCIRENCIKLGLAPDDACVLHIITLGDTCT
jgi:hypothetical protein